MKNNQILFGSKEGLDAFAPSVTDALPFGIAKWMAGEMDDNTYFARLRASARLSARRALAQRTRSLELAAKHDAASAGS